MFFDDLESFWENLGLENFLFHTEMILYEGNESEITFLSFCWMGLLLQLRGKPYNFQIEISITSYKTNTLEEVRFT